MKAFVYSESALQVVHSERQIQNAPNLELFEHRYDTTNRKFYKLIFVSWTKLLKYCIKLPSSYVWRVCMRQIKFTV